MTPRRVTSGGAHLRGITPRRVTSGGAHPRGITPGHDSYEETSQRWRDVDTVFDLTGPGIEPTTFRTDRDV